MSKITTFIWLEKDAHKAADYYIDVFDEQAKILSISQMTDTPSGTVEIISMEIFDQSLTLMSAGPFEPITAAISLVINCKDQSEIDRYWEKLTAEGEEGQCGWLKDKYGVSWQVIPENMSELMTEQAQKAMLKMKKIIIKELVSANEND